METEDIIMKTEYSSGDEDSNDHQEEVYPPFECVNIKEEHDEDQDNAQYVFGYLVFIKPDCKYPTQCVKLKTLPKKVITDEQEVSNSDKTLNNTQLILGAMELEDTEENIQKIDFLLQESSSYFGILFNCEDCAFTTSYLTEFNIHTRLVHRKTEFRCKYKQCHYSTKNVLQHATHESEHKCTRRGYKCSKCNFKTFNFSKFYLHKYSGHPDDEGNEESSEGTIDS